MNDFKILLIMLLAIHIIHTYPLTTETDSDDGEYVDGTDVDVDDTTNMLMLNELIKRGYHNTPFRWGKRNPIGTETSQTYLGEACKRIIYKYKLYQNTKLPKRMDDEFLNSQATAQDASLFRLCLKLSQLKEIYQKDSGLTEKRLRPPFKWGKRADTSVSDTDGNNKSK